MANLTIALRMVVPCITSKFAIMGYRSVLLCAVIGAMLSAGCGNSPSVEEKKESAYPNKFHNENVLQLYKWKDLRMADDLHRSLNSEDELIRAESALALGSVMNKKALTGLTAALKDTVWQVRVNAAFALGQIGDTTAVDAIVEAYINEPDPPVRLEMLQALGKCNSQVSIDLLDGYTPTTKEDSLGMMWGYYRLGLVRPLSPVSVERTIGVLQTPHTWMRSVACHVLARSKGVNMAPHKEAIIKHLEQEPGPEMRMALCLSLRNVEDDDVRALLVELAEDDEDGRVRVNALRALSSNTHLSMISSRLAQMITDPDPLVRVQVARALQKDPSLNEVPTLLTHMEHEQSWRVKSEIFRACLLSEVGAETKEHVRILAKERIEHSEDRYEQGAMLTALGGDPSSLEYIAQATFNTTEPVVSTAGMNAIISIHRSDGDGMNNKMAMYYKKALDSDDITMIGLAAGAIREFHVEGYGIDSSYLANVRDGLELPREVEAWIELQKTIYHLSAIDKEVVPPASPDPVDWEYIKKIPNEQRVQFSTAKGDIIIEVFVEETPASVGRFLQSVEADFYDGKTFHRVVPNFVAQGGCPRGDGWGSPNWSLRSEFTTRHYTTGSVGLASAGHDTESCQFFFTHSPTPHLDGRYTLFGQVVEGMDVVQELDVGDVIESVELLP